MRAIDADTLEPDAEWNDYYDEFLAYSQSQIDSTPTINSLPQVHGHWIDDGADGECSKCHIHLSDYIHSTESYFFIIKPRFCPSCGAIMDESENEYE